MMLQHDGIAVAGPHAVQGVSCPTCCWRPCIMMLQHDGIAVAGPHAVAGTPTVAGVLAS